MSDQITPGMVQTILRSIKVTSEAVAKVPPLLERIAVALEREAAREAARVMPRHGVFWEGEPHLVRTYECDNGAAPSVCRSCVAPLGQRHDTACPYVVREQRP